MKELFKPTINDFGGSPIAEHDMPCSVCLKRPAVYQLSAQVPKSGCFDPCRECQESGWFLSKVQPMDPVGKFLRKWFI